ncbi:hypothetical protein Leryth_026356 [Lithospermum erythrorhizon]|nr:hypothetical protein Leryth_026356 [Lithospermum erythrorhizon]
MLLLMHKQTDTLCQFINWGCNNHKYSLSHPQIMDNGESKKRSRRLVQEEKIKIPDRLGALVGIQGV